MLSADFKEKRRSKSQWNDNDKSQKKESPFGSRKVSGIGFWIIVSPSHTSNYDASSSQIF